MEGRVAVLGAGAWGTAVAKTLAGKGEKTILWAYETDTVDDINRNHANTRFLPGVTLPETLSASADIEAVVNGREFLILAVPSLFLMNTVRQILTVPSIREGETNIAVITKGFLPTAKGPRLLLETLEDYLPGFYRNSLVYIAGPSHAEEVARGKVTGLIAASENAKNSFRFRDLLKTPRLLVFSSLDVRGVQVAAAAKNVIAIAFGILDALKTRDAVKAGGDSRHGDNRPGGDRHGDNSNGENSAEDAAIFGDGTESLLLAAGLNEIQTLGMAMGATHAETFTSISGVGDLDVTCRSVWGRNRRFGREIIEKDILAPFSDLEDLLARLNEIPYLPEGVAAAKYVKMLAEKHRLRMPVSLGLYQILNREISPVEFVDNFLGGLLSSR